MDVREFQKLIIEKAEKAGFEDCEVYYEGGKSFQVMIHDGEIAHYENSSEKGISFRGTYKNNMGYAYSELIDAEAIDFLINEAKQNAEIIEDDEKEELFEGESEYPNVEAFNNNLSKVGNNEKINKAMEMEVAAKKESDEIAAVDYCILGYGEDEVAIANTKGLDTDFKSNFATAYTSVIAKRDEDIKTGGEYWIGNDWNEFIPSEVGSKAAKEAVSHLGAQTVKSGEYKILLNNEVASDLISTFAGIFFGENVQKGFSLLGEKKGKKIASDCVTIRDDGLYKNGMGTAPFDSEGVKSQNKAVVEAGVLKTLLYNLKSAKKDGVKSTGNGFKTSYKSPVQTACTNFYIETGKKTPEELINVVGNGLLITEIAGLHSGANTISGDFSLSAEGFLIENGRISRPVEQITIAGNFYELLMDIKEIGNDLRFGMPGANGIIGSPMIYIKKLAVSGC